MALPNRQVRGYTAQQGLRPTGATLISSGAGRLAGPPGMRAQTVGTGQRLTPATMTAARESEGVSQGLSVAGEVISRSILSYIDDKNRLEAVEKQAQLSEELSRLWLGYTKQELQADGTYKDVFVPGFSSLENREAVDGYGSYEEAVRAKFDEVADSMSPAVQQHFMASAVNTLTGYLNNGRQHAAASLRTWSNEALSTEVSRVSREVNNFLVTGDTDKVLPYLVDQFSMIGNKYPMNPAKAEKFKNDALMQVAQFLSTQDNASNKIKLFRDSLKGEVSLDTYVGMSKLHKAAIKAELTETRQQRRDAESAHKRRREETDRDLWERTRRKEKITENELDALFEAGLLTIPTYRRYAKIHGITGPGLDDTSSVGRLAPRDMYDIETSIIKGEIGADDIPELVQNSSDQSHLFNLLRSTETYSTRDALRRADTITDKMIGALPGVTATAGANVYSGVRRDVINFKNANPTQEPDLQTIVKENIERVLAVGTPSEKGGALQVLEHMQPTAIPLAEGKTFIPKDYVSLYMQVQNLKSQYGVDSTDQLPPEIYRAVQKWYVYIRAHADLYNVPKNVRDTWQTIKD